MIDLKDGFAHEETIVGVCHLVERGISCDPTEAWVGDGVIELLDSGERFGGSLLDVVSDAAGKDFDLVWLLQISVVWERIWARSLKLAAFLTLWSSSQLSKILRHVRIYVWKSKHIPRMFFLSWMIWNNLYEGRLASGRSIEFLISCKYSA